LFAGFLYCLFYVGFYCQPYFFLTEFFEFDALGGGFLYAFFLQFDGFGYLGLVAFFNAPYGLGKFVVLRLGDKVEACFSGALDEVFEVLGEFFGFLDGVIGAYMLKKEALTVLTISALGG